MKRFENIKNMTLDQMAEWLAGSDLLCLKVEDKDCQKLEGECVLCAKQWLQAEQE